MNLESEFSYSGQKTEQSESKTLKTAETIDEFPEGPVLVVLGSGWRAEQELGLNIDSKARVLAAGELFQEGGIAGIVFTGGKLAGENRNSLAYDLWSYCHRKFPDIEGKSILLEKESKDTSEDAEFVKEKILDRERPVILLTSEFHLSRAQKLFEKFNVDVTAGVAAERILKGKSPHYQAFFNKHEKSLKMKSERIKEAILRGLIYIDPKGSIPRRLAHRRGKS